MVRQTPADLATSRRPPSICNICLTKRDSGFPICWFCSVQPAFVLLRPPDAFQHIARTPPSLVPLLSTPALPVRPSLRPPSFCWSFVLANSLCHSSPPSHTFWFPAPFQECHQRNTRTSPSAVSCSLADAMLTLSPLSFSSSLLPPPS